MINKIHILGASGSGTTTLGKAISAELGYAHFDCDDFFWLPTNPPFSTKRDLKERVDLLRRATDSCPRWILTGSMTGWGDFLIDQFDLVIFLYLDPSIRLARLVAREEIRHGKDKISIGGEMHDIHTAFITWAAKYDKGNLEMRSLALHQKWLETIPCKVLKIDNNIDIPEKLELVGKIILN